MGEQVEKLAQFIARTRWDDMPEAVHRRAKLVLLDTIGVTLAGAARPEGDRAARAPAVGRGSRRHGPRGRTAAGRHPHGGTAERHRRAVGGTVRGANGLQPSPHILPGVLAIAEQRGLGGRATLRPLVRIAEDPAMTARSTPAIRPARVTLTLKDGRSATAAREASVRDTQKADPEPQVRAKFHELAAAHLTHAGMDAIEAAVDRCEEWQTMEELIEPLRLHARSLS